MISKRSCPICPKCGGKRFERLKSDYKVKVKCKNCEKILEI